MADDEDENYGGLYEDGHWVWDDRTQALVFVSDLPPVKAEAIQIASKAPTGTVEFRDDIDLIEQDVKDIAIYTAPVSILSSSLIDMLHLPTTERFLRALIFCCAYYLQVADEMAIRMLERDVKIRTTNCEILENEFRHNLSDLRVLVAKEYCLLLIELECHRIFKTDIFNTVEHTYKTGYMAKMSPEERKVLLGTCLMYERKLNTRSPLMNEVFCHRPIDYRMMGLGVVKYEKVTIRLRILNLIVAGPEENLLKEKLTVGIIGMRRSLFDIMLHPILALAQLGDKSKGSISKTRAKSSEKGSISGKSMTGKSSQTIQRFYPEIRLPPEGPPDPTVPSHFSEVSEDVPHVSQIQRRRWQNRLIRLTTVTA